MTAFLRIFEAKALASALTEAGHSVSERTVQRWKAGVTKPKPQDLRAIRSLLGAQTEEAPRPVWAEGLPTEVASEVVRLLTQSPLVGQLEARLEQLGLLPAEGSSEESEVPPGDSDTTPPLSGRRAARP